jgi:hypothetical protein
MIQERMAFGMNDTADEWDDKGGCKDILSVLSTCLMGFDPTFDAVADQPLTVKANTAVDVKPEERLSDAVVADNVRLACNHTTQPLTPPRSSCSSLPGTRPRPTR